MDRSAYRTWKRLSHLPLGRRVFSLGVAFKAPYFRTIRPRIVELRPGHCEVTLKKRWRVQNHIGTVHAIAMCNLAEVAAGVLAEVSVPVSSRWIPTGMTVNYLKKAETDLRAFAHVDPLPAFDVACDFDVPVSVVDERGIEVFNARITMRVSPSGS